LEKNAQKLCLPKFVTEPQPDVYLSGSYVCLDFETSSLDSGSALEGRNSIVLACWRLGNEHPGAKLGPRDHHCFGSEFEQGRLVSDIQSAKFVVAHNLKFEYQWLARCGIDLRTIFGFCTQIGQYVLNGNVKRPLSLESVATSYGYGGKESVVSALIGSGVCPSEIPANLLIEYCQRDVDLCEKIFLEQRGRLSAGGLLPVTYSRNLVTPCLAEIESRGMTPDPERVLPEYAKAAVEFSQATDQLHKLAGGINPRSAKQMREMLYGTLKFEPPTNYSGKPVLTGAGALPTAKGIISELKAVTPEQKEFKKAALEVAKLKKPFDNLKKMQATLGRGETNVFAQFHQTRTATHRLSSSGRKGGFQFQNFERAFKKLFKASRGDRLIVEADAPQLEFRVATDLTKDKDALRDLTTEGFDVHALTAQVLGVTRQNAKAHTFKPLYGGRSGTNKEKAYYKAFRDKYPTMYAEQTAWTHEVLKTGQLVTPWGLKFYWPGTKISRDGYVDNTTSIFNYPIQSFASAEIICLTLVLVWHAIKDMPVEIINTIHDSIIAEVAPKCVDEYTRILYACFTEEVKNVIERLYGYRIRVPLGVEIKSGTHWG